MRDECTTSSCTAYFSLKVVAARGYRGIAVICLCPGEALSVKAPLFIQIAPWYLDSRSQAQQTMAMLVESNSSVVIVGR